jgi:hypothetical protein
MLFASHAFFFLSSPAWAVWVWLDFPGTAGNSRDRWNPLDFPGLGFKMQGPINFVHPVDA